MIASDLRRPRFLVLGAAGQLGFELVRELAPLGDVRALSRAEVDLADRDALRAAVLSARPAVVVNAAAYTAVDAAETDREECALVNAVAPGVLAEASAEVRAAFVHYSTDYVFDGTARRPYRESDAPAPLNVYGETKLEGERAVAAAGGAHLTLRVGWLYATRGRNFLRTILRLARERDELRVVSDQIGTPTWARAVAVATAEVLAGALHEPGGVYEAFARLNGVYHLGAAGETTWHGFAAEILARDPAAAEQRCRIVRPVATSEYPTAARRPAYSLLCSDLAAERLGVRLADWREQLAGALNAGALNAGA